MKPTITRNGERVTIEIDVIDCEIVAHDLSLAMRTRIDTRKLVVVMSKMHLNIPSGSVADQISKADQETPLTDERSQEMLDLFTLAAGQELAS